MTTNQTLTTTTMPKLAINVRLDGAYELQNEATQCPVATMAFYPDERHERHAEAITHRVNCHDELVEILQKIVNAMDAPHRFSLGASIVAARTVLAKAKGQP